MGVRQVQQMVEQIVDVPVPMTQEEIVHVPSVDRQHRHHHVHVDHHVDVHVPHEQEEIVHVPVIQTQERIVHNPVEVPKIVVEERKLHVPKIHNTVVHTEVHEQIQPI